MGIMEGIICAMVTPYEDDGGNIVDKTSIRNVCNYLIENNINGIMVGGTNGEGSYLTIKEKVEITKVVCEEVNSRVPIIVQAGMITTIDTIKLISLVKKFSINAITILTPYFYLLDEESIFSHYKKIAEHYGDIPIYIYDIPSHTVNHISPSLAKRISKLFTNFQGIKYSNCDMKDLYNYIKIPKNNVFIGCDFLGLDALLAGAKGMITGYAMSFPSLFIQLYQLFKTNQITEAKKRQSIIRNMLNTLDILPSPALFKQTLYFKGIIKNPSVRSPLRGLNKDELGILNQIYKNIEGELRNV